MKLLFPPQFIFGTSTAATQIETAFEHDWLGVRARDGHIFDRTTDHEKRYREDVDIIASLAPHYRLNLMWSKLQRAPFAELHPEAMAEYRDLINSLRKKKVSIMLVLHHFANPIWFVNEGGWERQACIAMWIDFATKVVDGFGPQVQSINTFNEPNLYTAMGWIAGEFPPFKKNIVKARKVISHMGVAHETMYAVIKQKYPSIPVGISHNCTVFSGYNAIGMFPAKICDSLFMDYPFLHFKSFDFFGMSYYARIEFDPFPITYLTTPEKIKALKKKHDDMWEFYPQGLSECIRRYWHRYQKPIMITENGLCTSDDVKRIEGLKAYLKEIHRCLQEGIDIKGYYHWSTWDNFEWSLGLSYKFGLYHCDPVTKERSPKPSAEFYRRLAYSHEIDLDE